MITIPKFKQLAELRAEHCASVYLPTHRRSDIPKDKLQWKNALNSVQQSLESQGLHPRDARALLEPGFRLLDEADFWLHLSDGMAAFFTPEGMDIHKLPLAFEAFSFVGDRLYLRPLLDLYTGNGNFLVLAVNKNGSRLFVADRFDIRQVDISKLVPPNFKEFLALDEPASQLHMHSGSGAAGMGVFHGQGEGRDLKDRQIRQYLHAIDKGLSTLLNDRHNPMVLAMAEHMAPFYREISAYPHILQAIIPGNPEKAEAAHLHKKAWGIVQEHFRKNQQAAFDAFGEKLSAQKAAYTLKDIVPKAINGQVASLFVNRDHYTWGVFDPVHYEVKLHDKPQTGSIELQDLAAVQTLINGGEVFLVGREEMPRPTANLNAVYRF